MLAAAAWPSAPVSASSRYDWAGLLEQTSQRTDGQGLLLRAAAYFNLGEIQEALQTIDELGRRSAQDQVEPVMANCRRELEKQPDDLGWLHCLAVGYYVQGQVEPALSHLWRVVELDAENPWPLNLIALAELSRGNLDAARNAAERALKVDPANQYAHLLLAQVSLQQQRYLEFLIHYLRAPAAAREVRDYLENQQKAPQ